MSSHPDVIVVGAGLIGCAIAHALSRTGASVLVLDAAAPGSGASQASAGMLCPYIEGAHDPVMAQIGAESLGRYEAFVHRVRSDSGMDVPYVRNGTLQVADTEEEAEELASLAATLHGDGVPCHLASTEAEVRELEPLVGPRRAGLLIEPHGAVRIRDLVEALRHAALHQGARFLSSERVERLACEEWRLRVHTHAHTFQAPHVVVTAGAWAMQLPVEGHPSIPTHPVRGQLLRLQMNGAGLRRVTWGNGVYLVPWADELLVGATVEKVGFDSRATVSGVMQLCTAAQRLVPGLGEAAFTEVRVGLRPGSPDGYPILGASQRVPGLVFATGHFRNGALLAPLTADLVTDIVRTPSTPMPPELAASRFDL